MSSASRSCSGWPVVRSLHPSCLFSSAHCIHNHFHCLSIPLVVTAYAIPIFSGIATLFGLLNPEDSGSMHLHNVGNYLPVNNSLTSQKTWNVKFLCSLQEFFLNVKDVTRYASNRTEVSFYQKWEEDELELNKKFSSAKDTVHASLCGKNECLHVSSLLKPYQFPFPTSLS